MMAVNIEVQIPRLMVTANPLTEPVPSTYRIAILMSVVTLESKIVENARRKPASRAAMGERPSFVSSRMRSLMRTLASTDMPNVSSMPAMPGSVSVAPSSERSARVRIRLNSRATSANTPNRP